MNLTTCRQYSDVGPAQLCAGGQRGKDTCKGDSGGGLFRRAGAHTRKVYSMSSGTLLTAGDGAWHLLGLVSYGSRRCGDGRAGVYTRVASYNQWVQDTMDTTDRGGQELY